MIFSFGSFKIDTKTRQLYYSEQSCSDQDGFGQVINIQPRVYQLLVLLISHRDQALDKNTIQDEIWPNQILSETSLSRLIMKARKALNDHPENPTFIKTLHGFGFQFIAQVTETNDQSLTNQDKKERLSSTNKKSRFKLLTFFALAFTLVAILLGVYFTNNTKTSKSKIVILPVVNEIDDKSYQWISLGIPSLVKTMLEQSTDYEVIDLSRLSKSELINTSKPQLSNQLIVSLREEFSANQIVFSRVKKQGEQLVISFSVHKNTVQVPTFQSISSEPSQLAKNIVEKLTDHTKKNLKFDHIISENDFVNTLYGKGQSLLLQGHTQKARDLFKVAITEEPSLFWPRYSYSLTSRKLGLWEQAEIELTELLNHPKIKEINHAESRTRNILGFTYYRLRNYEQALTQYEIAYQLSELEKDFHLQAGIADNVGGIHWFNYEFDKARVWLTRAIAKRKESGLKETGHVYNLLGLLERDQGNLLKAQTQLTKSAKLFLESGMLRDYTMVQINLTTIDEHLGKFDIALTRLNESKNNFIKLEEKEGLNFLHRRFASIYLAKGNNQLAKTHVSLAMKSAESLQSKMRIALTKFVLGKIYLAENDIKNAESNLNEILNHHEEVWAPYLPFIKLAYLKKNQELLKAFFTKAIKDADEKNDRLSKVYAEATYQHRSDLLNNNRANSSNELSIIKSARDIGANRLMGEHLITLINLYILERNFNSALEQFQELDLLFPEWQMTKSLKMKLNYFQYKNRSLIDQMQAFKKERLSTWSETEEKWFNEMKNL
ncbi:MAG: winged helix-turn-helix domain-containing protein [Kangiellaceae bacterium]